MESPLHCAVAVCRADRKNVCIHCNAAIQIGQTSLCGGVGYYQCALHSCVAICGRHSHLVAAHSHATCSDSEAASHHCQATCMHCGEATGRNRQPSICALLHIEFTRCQRLQSPGLVHI